MKFKELGLNDELLEAISYMGFEEATPIQEKAIPEILKGKDLIGCAQTGTGKTGAFLLPVLHKLTHAKHDSINTLIIVPTRELAIQIDRQVQGFAYFTGAHSASVYGGGEGRDWIRQKEALTKATDIIIATPGKLISHLNMGYVKFENIQHLILDEADRMLDMGFFDDLMKIISFLPKKRQNLMFSATMPPSIRKLAKGILTDPFEISLAISKPAEKVKQLAFMVHDPQKSSLVKHILKDRENYESIIVFTSTKKKVFDIVRAIRNKNYTVEGISSDLEQSEREAVLSRFRSKRTRVIVATDVISRGIDIKDINLIINYDVPGDAEDYVHRIGRTARANTEGEGITFINEYDQQKFLSIETLIEKEIEKLEVPEELGKSPSWNPRSFRKRSGGGNYNRNKRRPNNKNRNNQNRNNQNRNRNNNKKSGNSNSSQNKPKQ